MAPRTPSQIAHFLAPRSPLSLILLTYVLYNPANWLIIQFIYNALWRPPHTSANPNSSVPASEQNGNVAVILVSFLKDVSFWKDALAKLGVDLNRAESEGTWFFIDGLRGSLGESAAEGGRPSDSALKLENVVLGIVDSIGPGRKVLLIIDGLDFLLAASKDILVPFIEDLLTYLRLSAHTTVITLAADSPLIHESNTPIEEDHLRLVISVAKQSNTIVALRNLPSGGARDVDGIMTVTDSQEKGEWLYKVRIDWVPNIWEGGDTQ